MKNEEGDSAIRRKIRDLEEGPEPADMDLEDLWGQLRHKMGQRPLTWRPRILKLAAAIVLLAGTAAWWTIVQHARRTNTSVATLVPRVENAISTAQATMDNSESVAAVRTEASTHKGSGPCKCSPVNTPLNDNEKDLMATDDNAFAGLYATPAMPMSDRTWDDQIHN